MKGVIELLFEIYFINYNFKIYAEIVCLLALNTNPDPAILMRFHLYLIFRQFVRSQFSRLHVLVDRRDKILRN